MTTHTLARLRGTLTFDVGYYLPAAEDRNMPYSIVNGVYRPDYLRFTLESHSLDDGKRPRYKDLFVSSVTLSGKKIKKDGNPGQQESSETFYSYEECPAWIQEVIDEAVDEIRDGAVGSGKLGTE